MSQAPGNLIQLLLDAEEEAGKIVRKARENRAVKLKSAVQMAEQDMELFKKQEQEFFEKELKQKLGLTDTTSTDLGEKTKKEIQAIKSTYEAHKAEVIAYLLETTSTVHLGLDAVQKRSLMESSTHDSQ